MCLFLFDLWGIPQTSYFSGMLSSRYSPSSVMPHSPRLEAPIFSCQAVHHQVSLSFHPFNPFIYHVRLAKSFCNAEICPYGDRSRAGTRQGRHSPDCIGKIVVEPVSLLPDRRPLYLPSLQTASRSCSRRGDRGGWRSLR